MNKRTMNTRPIRDNLMEIPGYTPHCGNHECGECPKTKFDGKQFVCPACGWTSCFTNTFIKEYKIKWRMLSAWTN